MNHYYHHLFSFLYLERLELLLQVRLQLLNLLKVYLGLVSTGIAWLLRFKILVDNGLIFQSQVSYLIPIFGTILSYIFLKELITVKVLISLIAVVIGIYFVRRVGDKKVI